ncbi:MAG: transporter substrate-binding domain-containing protein [Atopobiaceae bacterium]|nr:transporter substrate-binding domain-containing protein [Atopobiaceae bacterium]
MPQTNLSRRRFIGSCVAFSTLLLAACGPNNESAESPQASSSASEASASASASASEASSSAAAKDANTLYIGSEIAFAPYEWLCDAEGEYTLPVDGGGWCDGYDVQWAALIAEHLGKTPVFVNMSFGGLIDALNNGRVDMIISGMGDTEERRQSVAFSDPYKIDGYGLIVKKDSPYAGATELSDFEGASVLGQKSSPLDEVIDQIPGVVHMTPVEHVTEMLSQLNMGTCDAITCAMENAPSYLEIYPDLVVIEPQNPALDPGFKGSCVALRLDDTETLKLVNEVIAGVSQEENDAMWAAAEERQPK